MLLSSRNRFSFIKIPFYSWYNITYNLIYSVMAVSYTHLTLPTTTRV